MIVSRVDQNKQDSSSFFFHSPTTSSLSITHHLPGLSGVHFWYFSRSSFSELSCYLAGVAFNDPRSRLSSHILPSLALLGLPGPRGKLILGQVSKLNKQFMFSPSPDINRLYSFALLSYLKPLCPAEGRRIQ